MGCNCNSTPATIPAATTVLPEIAQVYPGTAESAVDSSCPSSSVTSTPTTGATLASDLTDAAPADGIAEGVTLLARYGRKLVAFTGSGFLQAFDGRFKLVKSIILRVTNLWHDRWTPAGVGRKPLLGNPFPFPFLVIADTEGNLHAIQGQQAAGVTRDSMTVWSFERGQYEVRDVADFPALQKGLLPQVSQIELAGFPAIPTTGSPTDVRQISALAAEGFFRLKKVPTIASSCDCEGCAAAPAYAYVTEFVADPPTEDDGTFSFKCTVADGVKTFAWVEDS